MAKQDYLQALEELKNGTTDISLIREVLPHLTLKEIKKYLAASDKGIETVVCAPPALVQDVAWLIGFEPEEVNKMTGEVLPKGVFLVGVTIDKSSPGFNAAQNYAKKMWGGELKPITWKDFVHLHFDNPKRLDAQGKPSCVGDVYFTIKDDFKRLNLDFSRTLTDLLNDSIVEITDSYVVATELSAGGDVNPMTQMTNNYFIQCSLCGAPLTPIGCAICEIRLKQDLMNNSKLALPKKVSEYMKANGWKFEIDPQVARDREKNYLDKQMKKPEYQELQKRAKIELIGYDFEDSMKPFYAKYRQPQTVQGASLKDVLSDFLNGF